MTNPVYDQLLRQLPDGFPIRTDVPMSECTTLRLGGPADLLAEPASAEELALLLHTADQLKIPVTVIGHGSNLLVRDGGIRGLVIRIGHAMSGVEVSGSLLCCGAGTMMGQAAAVAANAGLAGLAFASGIPGTVGGGVLMNAGAYGGEMSQVVERVEAMLPDGTLRVFTADELAFGYRTSRLQQERAIVVRAELRLKSGSKADILAEMAELNGKRAAKQPLEYPSAGSTFKRPVGGFAAALIDQCGLKGYRIGGAQVSEKHAGFLLNRGGTAADFLNLMDHVAETVERASGIRLEPEVRILGVD